MPQLLAIVRNRLPFFLALCAIIAAYLYSYSSGDRNGFQTFAYVLSVASLPWLFRSGRDRSGSLSRATQPTGLWLPPWDGKRQLPLNEFLAFLAVIAFGVFLRFWRWDFVPQGLWIDEILYTANGLRILDGAPTHFLGVMPLNPPNPSWPKYNIYNYCTALNMALFGSGQFGIKMLSILPGCATLPAFYWLLREIRGPRLAVIGTLMLSMSRWHLTFSRQDYACVFMGAAGVYALASLFRGLRTRRLHWVALGGAFLGLTPYAYIAGWLAAAGVFAGLIALTVFGQRACPDFRSHAMSVSIVCAVSFLVTTAPSLRFLHADTAAGTARVRQVSGGVVDFQNFTVDWKKVGSRIEQHVEAIVSSGPTNIRMNIPGEPLLLPIVSALSIIGACAQLAFRRGFAHPMTWSIFCLAFLGGVLTRGADVATQRFGLALPILYLWSAHGLEIVGGFLEKLGSSVRGSDGIIRAAWIRSATVFVLGVAIFYPGLKDVSDYFGRFAMLGEKHQEPNNKAVLISRAVERYEDTHQIWIDARGLTPMNRALNVLMWRPKRELNGTVVGGLGNPWYQMIEFTDWRSFPDPEGDKPIAFLSTVERPRELARVLESLESREFPNWYGTAPLFSVSFIDSAELSRKLAGVRPNP